MASEKITSFNSADAQIVASFQAISQYSKQMNELLQKNPQWTEFAEKLWCSLYKGDLVPKEWTALSQLESGELFLQELIGNKLLVTLATVELLPLLEEAEQPITVEKLQFSVATVNKKVEQLEALLSGLSINDAFLEKVSLVGKLQLADALQQSNQLKEIAYWSAYFKISAQQQRQKTTKKSIIKTSTTLGGKLERLLPKEYLLAQSPEAALSFVHRLLENKTVMYDYKRKIVNQKGMLIICYDESSSMNELDAQGKGFLLTLLSLMKKQRRDFIFIPFSGDVDYNEVQFFQKGKYEIPQFIALMQSYIGGGTNFQAPLKQAVQYMLKSKNGGDLLLITDGISHINEDFITEFQHLKAQHKFYMQALLIGHNKHPGQLVNIADEVIKLTNFQDAQHKKIFEL